jgi:hypothetical protein
MNPEITSDDDEEAPVVLSDLWPTGFDGSKPHLLAAQFFAPAELRRIRRDAGVVKRQEVLF